jgi:2-dehydro-3-deoxyphosphogluconate aldolase/(4S)-4-hydroxy-2-oxoglutarate aldolase
VNVIERIRAERVVGLLRAVPDAERVAESLVAGGISVLEVTMDSEGAEALIARLRTNIELTVLAGTVRTRAEVERAVAAGAEACVSPVFSEVVVATCLGTGVPAIPGAMSPTEIERAAAAGVDLVKLFPARSLGPSYVREVLAPLRGIALLATGGIDEANAAEFLRAGAVAVAAGSSLTRAEDPAESARRLVAAAWAA